MDFEGGYTRYACGREAKAHADGVKPIAFMRPEDKRVKGWKVVTYTDGNGVKVSIGLCPSCAKEYDEIARVQGREIAEWAAKGMI